MVVHNVRSQGKQNNEKNVRKALLKQYCFEWMEERTSGRVFQIRGTAAEKALPPAFECLTVGTTT